MNEVDLNLLPALDALLAEGSVAGAARRLKLSDSAMSRTLARLRAATGDPLLVRAGRGMVPTPRAAELREMVRDVAAAARAMLQPAAEALDLGRLQRTFAIRANEVFVEIFAARLIAAAAQAAPGVRLDFVPKPNKDATALRQGTIDLEIGVLGESAPEVRVQALFHDRHVGVVRAGHPILAAGTVTAEAFVAWGHVASSRRGQEGGPIDAGLAALGLVRRIAALVPSFPAAVAVVLDSDLVTNATAFYVDALNRAPRLPNRQPLASFPLPVETPSITISQIWHPRLDADPAHRWLRSLVQANCREAGRG